MEVNEVAARLLRRYWSVLLLALLLPMLAVAVLVFRAPATYTAHARIVAGASMPRSQAEATALVSQVQALATSRDVVATALSDSHADRSAAGVAKAIVVTGLGSSALVELSYTDTDRNVAAQVADAVANQVTAKLDEVQVGGLPDVLKAVDNQLTDLAQKRAPIAAQAQANPHDPVAQNRLAGIDRLISDLSGDRDRLAEESAAAGHATLVDTPVPPAAADPRGLPAKVGVAGILGLALGLIIVGANETVRPSVSGAARVGRLLEVPTLGSIGADPAMLAGIGRRVRLAARQAGVESVVLVRAAGGPIPPELVDRIAAAALRPEPVPARVAVPVDGNTVHATDGTGGRSALAVLNRSDNGTAPVRLARVCALDELDPAAEHERIGLVALVGGNTRLHMIDSVRDLMNAAGWPLLGVLGDASLRGGRR